MLLITVFLSNHGWFFTLLSHKDRLHTPELKVFKEKLNNISDLPQEKLNIKAAAMQDKHIAFFLPIVFISRQYFCENCFRMSFLNYHSTMWNKTADPILAFRAKCTDE